jgi:hypothetical protein
MAKLQVTNPVSPFDGEPCQRGALEASHSSEP